MASEHNVFPCNNLTPAMGWPLPVKFDCPIGYASILLLIIKKLRKQNL